MPADNTADYIPIETVGSVPQGFVETRIFQDHHSANLLHNHAWARRKRNQHTRILRRRQITTSLFTTGPHKPINEGREGTSDKLCHDNLSDNLAPDMAVQDYMRL